MSLETSMSELDTSIESLQDSIDGNTEVLRDVVAVLSKMADVLSQNTANTESASSLGGFKPGDTVLYFDSTHTDGLKGVVEEHDENPTYVNSVPVRRGDNGLLDRFPIRSTLLESAVPKPKSSTKWYDGQPGYGETQRGWNIKLARAAEADGLTLEFLYEGQKEYSAKTRKCEVEEFREIGTLTPAIMGTDPEVGEFRQFRIDRMRSYAKVVK